MNPNKIIMDKLLYYPYINLPKTDWTVRALMYYESVGSIVPYEYFNNPDGNYDPFMLELVRNELVIPIDPMREINNIDKSFKPFMDYLQSTEFEVELHKRKFRTGEIGRLHNDKFKSTSIHSDKFDGEIFYKLEQLGLAKINRNNYPWVAVELFTARIMMVYLATILADKLKMRPTTDTIPIQYSAIGRYHESIEQQTKHQRILEELIPFPQEINLSKLRKFKESNHESLESFRNAIELIILDDSIHERSDLFKEKVKELRIRKRELSERMNESRLGGIILGSICGIIGAFQGLSLTGTPGAIILSLPDLLQRFVLSTKS